MAVVLGGSDGAGLQLDKLQLISTPTHRQIHWRLIVYLSLQVLVRIICDSLYRRHTCAPSSIHPYVRAGDRCEGTSRCVANRTTRYDWTTLGENHLYRQLRSPAGMRLAKDVGEHIPNGLVANAELFCDFLVAHAASDERSNFLLPGAEH